jgi:ubiquinone/menaquinone biosynthesis C-methylase UbiE
MSGRQKVSADDVLDYYANAAVLDHYEEAATEVGLWESEKIVFTRNFSDPTKSILELGCGCGRIALGLVNLGYSDVRATDFSRAMVRRARVLAQKKEVSLNLAVADARCLPHETESVHGVIFGFNGLMQIPGHSNRKLALGEISRVLLPGGCFIFTTHDRSMQKWKKFWTTERKLWRKNQQGEQLLELGDRYEETPRGMLYLHVPEILEVKEDLIASGFQLEWEKMRSSIVEEPERVKKYSDDCRFWVARKTC